MSVEQKGVPCRISPGHKKAVIYLSRMETGGDGAARNPLPASPRLVDMGREKMSKEKS